jgi:hypothetical protein
MKAIIVGITLFVLALLPSHKATAQVQELEQLALDVQKLAQMKSILTEMYAGYQILTGGYNTVKSLAEGNFNLHNTFLTGLMTVSPTVKNYVRVADIIAAQGTIVSEYKSALHTFQNSGSFTIDELNYMTNVYSNLFDESTNNLSELVTVLTSNSLRMSDAERLSAIDRIYGEMQDKLTFLRTFNSTTGLLQGQRQKNLQETNTLKSLFGQ